jgi:hypothetical protein
MVNYHRGNTMGEIQIPGIPNEVLDNLIKLRFQEGILPEATKSMYFRFLILQDLENAKREINKRRSTANGGT